MKSNRSFMRRLMFRHRFYESVWIFLFWTAFLVCLAGYTSATNCTGDCLSKETMDKIESQCPAATGTIMYGVYPAGNSSAGAYTMVNTTSINDCALTCCATAKCHYSFMVKGQCFMLSCTYGLKLCEPVKIPSTMEGIRNNVSMVLIRNAPEELLDDSAFITCEVGVNSQCRKNQECVRPENSSKSRNGLCRCIVGYSMAKDGSCIANEPEIAVTPVESVPTSEKSKMAVAVTVESKNVTLPKNEVFLSASVDTKANDGEPYSYEWTLISHPTPDTATMEGQTEKKLHLSDLIQGTYVFQVTVSNSRSLGIANATINVLSEKHSVPPVAVITPRNQTVQLPTQSVVLDASLSKDDEKIISYKWEVQKGPVEYKLDPTKSLNTSVLQVENLVPGNYTIKLTVEDTDHLVNSTNATITVLKETDYPPTSIAGEDVVIYLPQTEVTLNGNKSTDDKKIVEWEWKALGDKGVDMQDTHTPFLKLSHLEEGIYEFMLKVTDESNQSATSSVHVLVKPSTGSPPRAVAGPEQTITLPQTWAVLDASASTSESNTISKYSWKQLSGPTNVTFNAMAKGVAAKINATGLTKGDYVFQVEVEDEAKLTSKSTVKISVVQRVNEPPVANAGANVEVTLPATLVILNGTLSKDDVKISEWKWERTEESLAAGVILEDSDRSPLLKLTDLVPGKYFFRLKVTDEQGLSDDDVVHLNVKENPNKKDLVEVILDVSIKKLVEADKRKVVQQLSLILHDIELVLVNMRSQLYSENAVLILYGINEEKNIVGGVQLVKRLKDRLKHDDTLLEFPFVSIDTVLCLDDCSGHGKCVDSSQGRICECNPFWMANFLKKHSRNDERNCEWSKIYVGVVCFLFVLTVVGLISGFIILFRKRTANFKTSPVTKNGHYKPRRRAKRQVRDPKEQYLLLGGDDDVESELHEREIESDTDGSSDSDVLFETKKSSLAMKELLSGSNGISRNGILKNGRSSHSSTIPLNT